MFLLRQDIAAIIQCGRKLDLSKLIILSLDYPIHPTYTNELSNTLTNHNRFRAGCKQICKSVSNHIEGYIISVASYLSCTFFAM